MQSRVCLRVCCWQPQTIYTSYRCWKAISNKKFHKDRYGQQVQTEIISAHFSDERALTLQHAQPLLPMDQSPHQEYAEDKKKYML